MERKCQCHSQGADERYEALDRVIVKYKDTPGTLITVLHKAQEIFGYLPEDVLKRVAKGMNLPASDVFGVATFYAFFSLKPRGKYKIGVCLGTACYVKGSGDLVAEIERQLNIKTGETTSDGKFSLEVTRCIGACGLAPVLTINDDVYGRLTPDKIAGILAKYE